MRTSLLNGRLHNALGDEFGLRVARAGGVLEVRDWGFGDALGGGGGAEGGRDGRAKEQVGGWRGCRVEGEVEEVLEACYGGREGGKGELEVDGPGAMDYVGCVSDEVCVG